MVNIENSITEDSQEILKEATVVNACDPQIYWEIRRRRYRGEDTILQRVLYPIFRKGGISVISASVYVPFPPFGFYNLKDAVASIGIVDTDIEQSSKTFFLADDYSKIISAKRNMKIAIIYYLQGLPPLEGELFYLRIFHKLGVRIIQLTYNERNEIANGCLEESNGKLSRFGVEVVKELNRLGILIDLTHLGERSFYHVIEISESPVVVSHSNSRVVCNHVRNLNNEQIIAIAQKRGVIGINAFPYHVKDSNPTIKDMLDHIDHIVHLVGVDHIGIGLDLSYYTNGVDMYPDLYVPPPDAVEGLETPSKIPNLIPGLMSRGYSREDILKIMGKNFLRVYQGVFKQE